MKAIAASSPNAFIQLRVLSRAATRCGILASTLYLAVVCSSGSAQMVSAQADAAVDDARPLRLEFSRLWWKPVVPLRVSQTPALRRTRVKDARAGLTKSLRGLPSRAGLVLASDERLLAATTVVGDPVLKIDFNTPSSPTETGWQSFNISGGPTQTQSFAASNSFTSGSLSVALAASAGNLGSRDRGGPADAGAFTLGELYRDFVTTDNNRALTLTISGLLAGTDYFFTFYAYDHSAQGGTTTFTNLGSGASGSINYNTSVTADGQFSLTLGGVANALGTVSFRATANANDSPRLNGFTIHSASGFALGQRLQASDGATDDNFGWSVSLSGASALVGAFYDAVGVNAYQGSGYLFQSLNTASGTITQSVKLIASDGAYYDNLGYSVSLSGSSALLGAPGDFVGANSYQGSAYFYRNLSTAAGTVTQNTKLTASDGAAYDHFGVSVSLAGNSALVGAPGSDRGSAYFFRNLDSAGGTVTQNAKLVAADGASGDRFGSSVSLSGSNALVGAHGDDIGVNFQQGSAYFFRNLDIVTGTVTQSAKLIAADGAADDFFGYSVSLSGTSALVGAYGDDDIGANSDEGSAYLFRNLDAANGTVTQTAKLLASDRAAHDYFGISVSISGNNALVGAYGDNPGAKSGAGSAYLFQNLDTATGTVTESVKLFASDGASGDFFGYSVSLDGDRFVVGASYGDGVAVDSGKAYSGTISSITTLNVGDATRTIDGISFISRQDWVVGETTSSNQVILMAGNSADVTLPGTSIRIGSNAGANANKLVVEGSVTANQVVIGTASGTTGNTLQIGTTGKVSAGTIIVNNGGTLLLQGTTASNDRLGANTAIDLQAGARLVTNGLSEGSPAAGSPVGVGFLTLHNGTTIDFGSGGNGSTLLFSSITMYAGSGGLISILNWTGSPLGDTGSAGNDRLLASFNPGFSPEQLASFQFFNDAAMPFAQGATIISYNGFYEFVPNLTAVPEPATWAAAALTALVLAATWRHRQTRER